MRFYVEQGPNFAWRVMLEGSSAPVSVHDTEEEARERLAAYLRGAHAAPPPNEGGLTRDQAASEPEA